MGVSKTSSFLAPCWRCPKSAFPQRKALCGVVATMVVASQSVANYCGMMCNMYCSRSASPKHDRTHSCVTGLHTYIKNVVSVFHDLAGCEFGLPKPAARKPERRFFLLLVQQAEAILL